VLASAQMATAIRTIGHEERLSVIEHLDELRARLIACALALALAFGLCMWQNHTLLHFINRPLAHQTSGQVRRGEGFAGQIWLAEQATRGLALDTASALRYLSAPGSGLSPSVRAALHAQYARLGADVARLPRVPNGNNPTTFSIAEPFTTTLTVALYCALVLALPLVLFELYGFLLPALTPSERRVVMPLLFAVPVLFAAGVAFGYLVVLPAAVRFLQNFNSSQFNQLVQASQYYKFAATVMLAMGLAFQAPVAIIGAVRGQLVTPRQLRRNRRYALLACAALAAFLPGDLITLLLETVPLYLLYEVSILVATVVARRDRRWAAKQATAGDKRRPEDGSGAALSELSHVDGDGEGARGAADSHTDSSVKDKIDHTDPDLT
jgi:sec-independent protein translocase protein TatC